MINRVHTVDYLEAESEVDAMLKEARLIKDIRPPYNMDLTDDKTFPYLEITAREDFPASTSPASRRGRARYCSAPSRMSAICAGCSSSCRGSSSSAHAAWRSTPRTRSVVSSAPACCTVSTSARPVRGSRREGRIPQDHQGPRPLPAFQAFRVLREMYEQNDRGVEEARIRAGCHAP